MNIAMVTKDRYRDVTYSGGIPKAGHGAISLKILRGKISPKLVCIVLRKELLNLSETAPGHHLRFVNKSGNFIV